MSAADDRLMLRFLVTVEGACSAERLGGSDDGRAVFGVF